MTIKLFINNKNNIYTMTETPRTDGLSDDGGAGGAPAIIIPPLFAVTFSEELQEFWKLFKPTIIESFVSTFNFSQI